jgi:signal transduction histidine kinase
LVNTDPDDSELSVTYKHRKSTGETFDVSITSYPVLFNNQRCQLVMATDVSDLLEKDRQLEAAYKKIRNSNQTLLQIAWSNSHELRRPLCSIMSLVGLLKEAPTKTDQEQYLELLDISSTELDEMLKHNNEKVTEIELQEVG